MCPSAENGTIMIQFGHQMPDYNSPATQSTSESHQEVSGMSEGSLNDHNDQSGLAHTHCAVLVLAKKG